MNRAALQQGFSLVELMIATLLSLIISYAVIQVYLTQSQLYRTANSQALILNSENALINLLTPTIRAAGFLGCGTTFNAISNLNNGADNPLGSINTLPTMIAGYNGSGATYSITSTNPVNSTASANWTPALPASLLGQVEAGNDVVILLGAIPGTNPIGVTTIDAASNSLVIQSTNNTSIAAGQLGAVSDCAKSIIFQISGVTGNTLSHTTGSGVTQNASSVFPINFQAGALFTQVQQTAFFVGQGQGGQSTLMRGVLTNTTWTIEPLIPGVEFIKIQYGIGDGGLITQYVAANAVVDWSKVYALRIGFLIAGKIGSSSTKRSYTLLDTTITVPADNRLRHPFEMTIHLRNSL